MTTVTRRFAPLDERPGQATLRLAAAVVGCFLTLLAAAIISLRVISLGTALATYGTPGLTLREIAVIAAIPVILLVLSMWCTAAITRAALRRPDAGRIGWLPPALLVALLTLAAFLGRLDTSRPLAPAMLLPAALCLASAASLLLVLADARGRVVGACALAAALLAIALAPTPAERALRNAQEQRIAEETAVRDAALRERTRFLDAGAFPIVPAVSDGSAVTVVLSNREQVTTMTATDGTTLEVHAFDPSQVGPALAGTAGGCVPMQRAGEPPLSADNPVPSWCIVSADGWTRTDGLASAAVVDDARYVLVSSPSGHALPVDVFDQLRVMTRAEVDAQIMSVWPEGDSAPPSSVRLSFP